MIRRVALDALITTLIATLLTGLLSLGTGYATAPNGTATVGQRIAVPAVPGNWVIPVEVDSYLADDALEVTLEVPRGIDRSRVSLSRPLTVIIDSTRLTADRMLLHLQGFPARSSTRVLLAVDSGTSESEIVVRNAGRDRIEVGSGTNLQSRLSRTLASIPGQLIPFALVFFLINFAFARWFLPKLDELEEKLRVLQAEGAKQSEDLRRVRDDADNRVARIRTLLVSRIADLQKELSFWRDALRSYVVHRGRAQSEAAELLQHVSERLETWSSRSDAPDTDSIRIAAALLESGDARLNDDRRRGESLRDDT